MYDKYILEALQKRVDVATTPDGSPPPKAVGRNFEPPDDGKWWEVVFLPNNVENEFWGDGKTYQGVLRMVLHWPQDGKGAYPAMEEAERFAAFFEKGLKLTDPDNTVRVKITTQPDIMPLIEESPRFLIPLTIRYTSFII